ncbi:hypothetical protein BDR04DRAFT_1116757 [Suillus decipiens]|nr:hypothetical protein BDR04DRAFT_1116757 [Suillus decipiens]
MEGTLIVLGVSIAYWVDLALSCIGFIQFVTLRKFPKSPRWLVKHGRNAEAMAVLPAMEDKPPTDPEVQRTYYGICEAVGVETSSHYPNIKFEVNAGSTKNWRDHGKHKFWWWHGRCGNRYGTSFSVT